MSGLSLAFMPRHTSRAVILLCHSSLEAMGKKDTRGATASACVTCGVLRSLKDWPDGLPPIS
eukprot:CAMPEP_0197404400 /NCGR_PEP_ID=MMETSP1165-20131217/22913_1 /TAXON_ID=284809 /ORGANISM="Chrysocystis fragilis, Strain CCMP3189" /LENGTH=61 /DNA_ID=CAMNT_0042930665 /DNA_START=293 /DNA_END=478 /DNA_ORIENTATION=+